MKYVLSGRLYVNVIFVLYVEIAKHQRKQMFYILVIMQKEASSEAAVPFTKNNPWK